MDSNLRGPKLLGKFEYDEIEEVFVINREFMREVFDKWDLNHDGKIVKGELQEIMIKAGLPLTEEELTVIFNRLDVDKDGTINFEEFMAIAPNNRLRSSIKGAFERLDNDGDGYITKSEMRKAFQRVGQFISEKELNEIYKSFDIDSDGKINLEEFRRIINYKRQA